MTSDKDCLKPKDLLTVQSGWRQGPFCVLQWNGIIHK